VVAQSKTDTKAAGTTLGALLSAKNGLALAGLRGYIERALVSKAKGCPWVQLPLLT
jgi:hypothetical protein